MTADRLGRFELIATWTSKIQELTGQGECAGHLQRFLEQVQALPGDEVGEIGNQWRRRQRSQRPYWVLTILLGMLASGWLVKVLGAVWAGVTVLTLCIWGCLRLIRSWSEEEAFDRELYMRAHYALHCPAWSR
jgi:hypothetical protein